MFTAFVPAVLLTVVILVALVAPVLLIVVTLLLRVLRFVLTFVTFVLTEFSRLLRVVILVVFVVTKLLTARTAPVLGIAVSREPSPINLPKIDPDEIVEKNPKLVDIVIAEILEADRNPVLRKLVLRMGGKLVNPAAGRPVRSEPSPTKRPNTDPDEIVETNNCCVERIWKRPVPATSRATVGTAIPIPTFEEALIIIAGVTLLEAEGNTRALTPGSKTIVPVVCIRMRSDADEPLKTSNS
jgi:hypothetical protein